MRILIIDSDPSYTEALQLMLMSAGHTTVSISDMRGLELCEHEPEMVIISPTYLPGGLANVRALRAKFKVPIITLFDGVATDQEKIVALTAGDNFLSRPASQEELLATVEQLARLNGRCAESSGKPPPPSNRRSRVWGVPPRTAGYAHVHVVAGALRSSNDNKKRRELSS